jgi:hypothetical protein
VQQPIDAHFGPSIRLLGYDLQPPSSILQSPVSNLQLVLHWQALAPIKANYKLFLHLVGEGGPADIRAQTDVYPHPATPGWLPGEYLSDRVTLDLPAGLPPGHYSLLLGLYDEVTGQRLPVLDTLGQAQGDSLLLQELDLGE